MNALTTVGGPSFSEMERLADAIARSGMFGIKTKDQALVLMSISQAEGRHPALAARDYDIIGGRPAKKSEAMFRDFLEGGGKVQWHTLDDTTAEATFSHPAGGTVRLKWDMQRAEKAGLGGKENYKKYPRQMLRSRVISEGVKTVYPLASSGMYTPEEVRDMEPLHTGPIIEAQAEAPPPADEKPARPGGMVEVARAVVADPGASTLKQVVARLFVEFGQAQSIGTLADIESRDETRKILARDVGSDARKAIEQARDAARERLAVIVESDGNPTPAEEAAMFADGERMEV